jgi:hypothetical protein
MDVVYLQQRYDRSILNMRNAACEPARSAHARLAALYAGRIALADTHFSAEEAGRPAG